MKITIDNHDGLGLLDYTPCLSGRDPFVLHRKLNEVTSCTMLLDCNVHSRVVPSKFSRVIVTPDNGLVMFTGYVVLTPAAKLVGAGVSGLLYLWEATMLSDEMLLDQQVTPVTSGSSGLSVLQVLQSMTQRIDPVRFSTAPSSVITTVGTFVANSARKWSENAGALMAIARSSYRMVNQQLAFIPIGSTTHILTDTNGTFDISKFAIAQDKTIANDITLCGKSEPQAYVTEVFQGDGTTTTFPLTRRPVSVSSVEGTLAKDNFQGPSLNKVLWQLNDPGSRIALTSAGLTINGGNGMDGQTTLTTIDNMEMGGSLVLTVAGVQVAAGSAGYVGCFYNGSVLVENLFAGFNVTQGGGRTIVTPILNKVQTGSSTTLMVGHAYTFRLRYYCVEMQRVLASYYVDGGDGQQLFGGGIQSMPAQLVFEVQDTTGGVNQPTLVLYDGSASVSPATCLLCAVNSVAFTGSIQSVLLEQTGTAWVRSQQATGAAFTRRIGLATAAADCKVDTTQKLVFYATSVPQVGEQISITYRTTGKAVARLQNAASITTQGTTIVPGISRWIGSVTSPAARSSIDCENAALAMLAVSTSPASAWSGKYVATNLQQSGDVWPGDTLALQSATLNLNAHLIVRTVVVTVVPEEPETLIYTIGFANDWADSIGVKTSSIVPSDAWLPQTAATAPSSLQNLTALTTSITASQIVVTAGIAPPAGGGFEVRRVDWQFGPGSDGTLVLRSTVPDFSIIREAAVEQYYVRMYDASVPPDYSRFSSVICANVPLQR